MAHYFSPDDGGPRRPRDLTVRLRGREVTVGTDAGVFSNDRLDPGTAVLLAEVPAPPATGVALDLGCGWGPISLALAQASPGLTVHAVDVNPRALALTAANAERNGLTVRTWTPSDLLAAEPELAIDVLWSNPPIRVGKAELHEMLRTWLPRLSPSGAAYLVVNKNLGADSLHRWIEDELGLAVERTASSKGFRVLRVSASAG